MYRVALIQNQSEMSHYSYADARPFLEELKYETYLYTAENIKEIAQEIKNLKLDAVIFSSNALNDKTIRSEVMSSKFKDEFLQFLMEGKGCLILHQLRLAQLGFSEKEKANIQFLPEKLSTVQPIARESNEKVIDGQLHQTVITDNHTIWLYPNDVNISETKSQCLLCPSLKGLYWHYWDKVDNSAWDVHIYDESLSGTQRPLIISSKEADKFRIVLSSLILDWQNQKNLFENILRYIVEGRHLTAILTDRNKTSVAFDYLINLLCSQKYPFKLYYVDKDLSLVEKNIRNGIHTIILLSPFVNKEKLGEKLYSLIKDMVLEGNIKLIGIEKRDSLLKSFFVAGRERFPLRLLYDIEMKVQKDLKSSEEGYIDDSFWNTVESLQTLYKIGKRKSELDFDTLNNTFQGINKHDRYGSYDAVFRVSCALLWLKGKFLGIDSKDTIKTLTWIRENLNKFEDRERVLAYSTFIDLGIESEEDLAQLENLLHKQCKEISNLSENDLIIYLGVAIQIKKKDVVTSIIIYLGKLQNERLENEKLQNNGLWTDLATTATVTVEIIDALALLKEDSTTYGSLYPSIEFIIFKSIIYILSVRENNQYLEDVTYPWGDKASTSLKCIYAWLKFEDFIDLPVYEIIESLKSYSKTETQVFSSKISLDILEDIKQENRKLLITNAKLNQENEELKIIKTQNRKFLSTFLISLYLMLSIMAYLFNNGLDISISTALKGAFVDNIGLHIAFLSLVVTVIGITKWKNNSQAR